MKKKKIILLSIIISIILVLTVSSYAVFQAVYKKYPATITTTNVSFIYNGKNYLSEIETKDITLNKGDYTDLEMSVETIGSERIIVDYSISFSVLETENDKQVEDMLLANVIDVYYYNGYRYEYIDNLANFNNLDAPFQGKIISNNLCKIKLRLQYSDTTFDEYDSLCQNRNVKIKTDASGVISTSQANYKFVGTEDELKKALLATTSTQIYLTNDIELNSEITTTTKHGIDINGHTLTLNKNINFNYLKTVSDEFKDNLYIGSSSDGIINPNGGNISIDSDDIFLINNDYISSVSLGNTNPYNSLKALLVKRMNEINGKKEYQVGDELSLLDGIWIYKNYINKDASSNLLEINFVDKTIKISNNALTTNSFSIYLSLNAQGAVERVYSELLIKGNSLDSIFTALKDSIKEKKVSSTINLKAYDNATNTHIEYVIDDGFNGSVLNNKGIYQSDGISFIGKMSKLNVIRPKISVKLSRGNETKYYTIETADSFIVFPLTNEQIGSLLINNSSLSFVSDTDALSFDTLLTSFKDKLANVSITEISIDDNKYQNYLNKIDNTISFVGLSANAIYDTSFTIKLDVLVSEGYSITISKKVNATLLGKESYVTKYDIKNRLSSKFNENDYINGNTYSFNVYGALAPTVSGNKKIIYIKYNIPSESQSYVSIIYKYATNSQIESQVAYFLNNNDSYEFIDIDERTTKITSLNGNDTLFVLLSDDDNYSGTKYTIDATGVKESSTGNYAILYSLVGNVNILSNKVPQDEVTNVNVKAELYEYSDFSGNVYNGLTYSFNFPVEGIIHYGNDNGNVKNNLFYNALQDIFDANNDNMITYSEAHATLSSVKSTLEAKGLLSKYLAVDTKYNLEYLKFDGISIDYLDGLENFSNISGFSFNSCGFTDLSKLRRLHNLTYFSATNNRITNIEPLNLLDNLIYLNLSNNSITSIADIAYLSSLSYLNFDSNKITDFEALENMTTIKELYLRNMTKNGTEFPNDFSIAYQLTLVMVNCASNNAYPTIKTGSGSGVVFNVDSTKIAAVEVLKQLETINRVSKILYLPTSYIDANGTSHTISWSTSNYKVINILNETDQYGSQVYKINSPIIDTPMDMIAQVDGQSFQRRIRVTVIKSDDSHIFLYSNGNYYDLTANPDLIPDASLINAFFTSFNNNNTTDEISFTDSNGNIITTSEKYVISKADYDHAISAEVISTIDWSNYGIESLTGMVYLAPYFKTGSGQAKSLNLEGNPLDSLVNLKYLTEITELRLGGSQFDFNELIDVQISATGTSYSTPLNISNFYVSKCYRLDNDDVLAGLFKIYYYANKSLNIYIDETTTAWNPYEKLINKKMSYLPSIISFNELGSYDLFNTKGIYTSSSGFEIYFYGIKHIFKESSSKIYTRFTNKYSWQSNNDYFDITNGTINYKKLIASNETSYLVSNLTYSNSKGVSLNYEYILQINCEDHSNYVVVYDKDRTLLGNKTEETLSNLFGSKELKEDILTKLHNSFINETAVTSLESLTDSNYALIDNTYYISLNRLKGISFNNNYFSFSSMTSNDYDFLYGLRYLPNIKSIFVKMDFNAGDGADLINLESISTQWSYIDFSNLTTRLSNLKTINIKEFNGFVINDDIGSNMPNLSSLTLNQTNSKTSDYEYFDLNNLRYFISNGKCSLEYLYLNGVTYSNGSNPGFSNPQTRILIDIRNAYKASVSGTYKEPSYYIGTPTSNKFSDSSKLLFNLTSDGVVDYVYIDSNTKWSASGASSSNTKVDEFDSGFEDKLLSNMKYSDLGLSINDNRWSSLNEDAKVNLGLDTKLTLPTKSGKIFFGISNTEDGTNLKNNYNIDWYLWKISSNNNFTSKTKLNSTNGDDYIYTCSEDGYLVLVGILNDKYFFIYQFVVGNGDGVYSIISNNNLRLWAFVNAEVSNSKALTMNQSLIDYVSVLMGKSYSFNSSYSSNITISSIDDLANSTIKKYLISKLQDRITTLNLNSSNYTDFSFFEGLTSIKNLNISRSAFIIKDLSMFTSLTKADLSNNKNIKPTIITNLSQSVTELNLQNTKCDYNLDTFTYLKEWFNSASTSTLKLSINSTSSSITSSNVADYLSRVEEITAKEYDITSQGNEFYNLYTSGSVSTNIYKINWDFYKTFQSTIGNYAFVPNTATTVYVSYRQTGTVFSNIAIPLKVMGSTASVPRFRSSKNANGLGINDLNYELISYAINQNAFIYQNGMFELKDNVEIYWSDTLFKSLSPRNFDNFITKVEGNNLMFYLVDGGNCIKIHLDQDYYNLYSMDDFKPSYTKSSDTKLDIINSQDLLSNIKFEFDNLSYEYYNENIDDNNVYLNVKMPGYIFIDGVPYKISIKTEKNNHSELIYNGLNPSQIVIDSSTLVSNKVFNEGSTTSIKFQLYLDDLNIVLGNKKNVMTISIYHGQSTDVLIDSYDLYVETLKDEVGYYITSGVNKTKEYVSENKIIFATKENDTRYNLDINGNIYLIRGSELFVSGRFQIALIKMFKKYSLYEGETSTHRLGVVISTSSREGTTKFANGASSGQSDAVSSIEGIQYFCNLREFDVAGGIFQSIEPLRSLSLTKFLYRTSDTNTYTMVEDFSPLLAGSLNSLIEFQYASRSNTFVNDFSFLLKFNKLKYVYMFSVGVQNSSQTSNGPGDSKAYKHMSFSSFAYLVDALNNKNIEVIINKNILGSNPYLEPVTQKWSSNEYTVRVKAEYKEAIRLLNLYETSSVFDMSPTISNNYILNVGISDNYVYLPATLNDSGNLYLINYQGASALLGEFKYVLKTGSGEEELTGDEALSLIKTVDFYTKQIAKEAVLYVKIKIASNTIKDKFIDCGYMKVNMRILVGSGESKYYTERVLTLSFS